MAEVRSIGLAESESNGRRSAERPDREDRSTGVKTSFAEVRCTTVDVGGGA